MRSGTPNKHLHAAHVKAWEAWKQEQWRNPIGKKAETIRRNRVSRQTKDLQTGRSAKYFEGI